MNISSRQLKAFVLTARHQSFSRAAEQLFMTQSGMSVLMRELEGQLGFRLFDRTTRKVALTEFGTKFLPIADRSLLELESAASVIGRAASVANRRIAIGATPLIASKLLPSVISDFAAHPDFPLFLDGDRAGGAACERAAAVVALEGYRRVAPDRRAARQPDPAAHRPQLAALWPPRAAGHGVRLLRDADRDGGSGRRLRGHSDFRDPGLPPPPHRDASAQGSRGADRALPNRESRQEAAARIRGLHPVPQELYRGMGGALVAQVRLNALRDCGGLLLTSGPISAVCPSRRDSS